MLILDFRFVNIDGAKRYCLAPSVFLVLNSNSNLHNREAEGKM